MTKKRMKSQSRKAKGRLLQQQIRDKLLAMFPELDDDDIKSTSMGAPGEDIQLSPAARKRLPMQTECKNINKAAIYKHYEQAERHGNYEPVVFLHANHKKKTLAIIEDRFLLELLRIKNAK